MKLEEVASTGSMENHGINFSQFKNRQLFCQENGKEIYQSVASNGQVMLDIDQKAFVVGDVSNTFAGKVKNDLFVTRRGYCDPSVRSTGLITTIMMGLFRQKDFAIMSDNIFSPDGRATWMKLCKVLPVTNYYMFDQHKKHLEPIDYNQMVDGLSSDNEDIQFIIEHRWSQEVELIEEWIVMVHRGNGGGLLEKYDLVGLL